MRVVNLPYPIEPKFFTRSGEDRPGTPVDRRMLGLFSDLHNEYSDTLNAESLAGRCRIVDRVVQR